MKNVWLLLVMVVLLVGCTSAHQPPPFPIVSPSQTSIQPQEERDLTIAEVMNKCQRIEKANSADVGCVADYLEGQPSIFVLFADANAWQSYFDTIREELALPFCFAASSVNRQAFVVLGIHNTKQAAIFSCETSKWGEWFDYSDKNLKGNLLY